MIEEQATVVNCEGQYAWVQTQRKSSCGSCSVREGCGTQVLSKLFGNRVNVVKCLNDKSVIAGDQVVIGIDENALLSGSLLLYLLPLLLMIVFAATGVALASFIIPEFADLFALMGSGLGLITGLKYLKFNSQKKQSAYRYQPVILNKVIPRTDVVKVISKQL